ncbi:MAG: RHS repeat-associated core domain-containing protein, partial [Acholeplasmataceae bacterium]|nr:RHS repeat-associated core domain-containing protein [Acholeplasmataceae bacterium]
TTDYILDGDRVLVESRSNGITLCFTYDVDGSLLSVNYNGNEYFYITNRQGDVIELVDVNGQSAVKYNYDAWGNMIYKSGGSLADINPYRYRGYRFDIETGLYYLQSRYYDPAIGRFISSDGLLGEQGDSIGHNIFAYCANNPVMRIDPTGETWGHWAIAGGVVLLLVAATILTGGVAGAFSSILLATSGLASASTAMTLLSFTAVGATLALTASVLYAGTQMSESSLDGFGDLGELGMYSTITGGLFGLFGGYISDKQQMYQCPGSWRSKQISYWISNGYSSTPKGSDGYPMELHHPYGRFGSRIDIYYPVTRTEHQHIHSQFGYGRSTGGFNQYYPFDNWWQPIVDVFR